MPQRIIVAQSEPFLTDKETVFELMMLQVAEYLQNQLVWKFRKMIHLPVNSAYYTILEYNGDHTHSQIIVDWRMSKTVVTKARVLSRPQGR